MSENTQFEEYQKKTGRIMLIIAIFCGVIFLFGWLLLSQSNDEYNPEEAVPDYVENDEAQTVPDVGNEEDSLLIQTDSEDALDVKKAITIIPAQINMNEFILGVDTQNQTVLTIGTDGTESIHIERV
jgi:cytoskeletal protein RodZ